MLWEKRIEKVNENHTEKSLIFKSIVGTILAQFWKRKSFPKVSKNQLKILLIFIPILYRFWLHFGVPKRDKIPEKSRKNASGNPSDTQEPPKASKWPPNLPKMHPWGASERSKTSPEGPQWPPNRPFLLPKPIQIHLEINKNRCYGFAGISA